MDNLSKYKRDSSVILENRRPSMMSEGALGTEGRLITDQAPPMNDKLYDPHFHGNFKSEDGENDAESMPSSSNDKNNHGYALKNEAENISNSNEYFQKVKAIEILASFWAFLQLGNSIIIYEVTYNNNDNDPKTIKEQLLAVSTLTSIGLTISIVLRHLTHLKWKRSKLYCLKDETIWSSGYWKLMIIEAIMSALAPQYFFEGYEIDEYVKNYDVTITYELNTLLCCSVWIKCYVILRTVLVMTKFYGPRSQRICKMNGCEANLMFSVRGCFKENQNSTLLGTIVISGMICAYMLRIFERPLSDVSGQNFNRLDTAMWLTIVTMTTVGYGDQFPKTTGGRLLGICICLWGVLLVSLFVVTVSSALEFTIPQKNAYNLIHRIHYREQLKNAAAGAIFSRYRIKMYAKSTKTMITK